MHPRVHRAYWNHEYAMHTYYIDMRWPLVVSGLEALVNVGESNVTQQFRLRVLQLATEFQIPLTEAEAFWLVWRPSCRRASTALCMKSSKRSSEPPSDAVLWTRSLATSSVTARQ
jgi:hypothetical protein